MVWLLAFCKWFSVGGQKNHRWHLLVFSRCSSLDPNGPLLAFFSMQPFQLEGSCFRDPVFFICHSIYVQFTSHCRTTDNGVFPRHPCANTWGWLDILGYKEGVTWRHATTRGILHSEKWLGTDRLLAYSFICWKTASSSEESYSERNKY
jgi:hypothetical protein